MRHAKIATATSFIVALTALAACGGDSATSEEAAGSGELTEITYAHSSAPTVSFTLFECVARKAGFWEEEGLDVKVESIDGGTAAMQSLQAGQSDIVDTGTSVVLPANQAGSDTPAFHTLVTGPFVYPAVPEDSDINEMIDLEGKRIGVLSLASGGIPYIKSLLAADGGDAESIEFVPVGTGAPAVVALENGEIDALGFADTEYALIESRGTPLKFITNEASDNTGFGVAYSARRDWLAENGETATAFSRAANKAFLFTNENPEAAVRMCWDVYPDMKPSNLDEDDALAEAVTALEARLGSSGPVDGLLGNATTEQVEAVINMQVEAGVLETGMGAEEVWMDDFVEAANDFDHETIIEMARNYEN